MFKHPGDNHESQPEKRRRAEVSSSGQLPLSKTANKHGIANTPTKTSSTVATEPTQPPPSTSTTPLLATTSAAPSATQAPKSTSAVGKDSTEPSSGIPTNSNVKAGDSSALKPPQTTSTPSPINGKSSPSSGGKNQAISDSLSSAYDTPSIDDKQVILPPKRIEKEDTAEGMIGDYQTHLDDILWTGVDVTENVQNRKGSDKDQPKKKLTAMVSFDCGTSNVATKVLVTIAQNGLDTRFEVTQEGLES